MPTIEDLVTHIMRLWNVVLSAHLKRALTAVNDAPRLNFWRLIYGNLLDVAVLEWCKIFGTDTEPTHWKRVVVDHDVFRRDLLTTLGIDEAAWAAYWVEMKGYRDALVAHHIEPSGVTHFPSLDLALESCYFYYTYLIRRLREKGDSRFPNDLREYSTRFTTQARKIAEKALGATADIRERVF